MLLALSLLFQVAPAGAPVSTSTQAAPGAGTVRDCASAAGVDFSAIPDAPTHIKSAQRVEATEVVPAHCLVRGYIAPQVGIELHLPLQGWNGKFLEVGCGGYCGVFFSTHCHGPLRRGYACIASNMGHDSTATDAKWAYNDLQAQIDWAYRATHVAAVAGKAITEWFYSQGPSRSYYTGCSTGGRQGLIAAQRFPDDFDGIVAGAPVVYFASYPLDLLWPLQALTGADGNFVLSKADARLLHDAVLAQCDLDDGVKDGVIGNPLACRFDPAELQCRRGRSNACLTESQVRAVQSVYAGPKVTNARRAYPQGAIPGSELNWVSDQLSFTSTGRDLVLEGFRYMIFMPAPGPTWNLGQFDFNKDVARTNLFAALASANNPDLREFAGRGGKLISYFGWQDPSPPEVVDYYETVERTMGGRDATQDFFRLFMVPGMDHCTGGAGPFAIDYLSYLEDWVEKGKAPDVMIGAHVPKATGPEPARELIFPLDPSIPVTFTRPVYPYPIRAVYSGAGDPNDAASFVPADVPQ